MRNMEAKPGKRESLSCLHEWFKMCSSVKGFLSVG